MRTFRMVRTIIIILPNVMVRIFDCIQPTIHNDSIWYSGFRHCVGLAGRGHYGRGLLKCRFQTRWSISKSNRRDRQLTIEITFSSLTRMSDFPATVWERRFGGKNLKPKKLRNYMLGSGTRDKTTKNTKTLPLSVWTRATHDHVIVISKLNRFKTHVSHAA